MNTKYWLNTIAGNIFNVQTDPPLPQKLYFGVSTSYPSDDQTGVIEPKGGGYERVELTSLSLSETGMVTNGSDIQMPESTSAWGVLTSWVVYDAPTGGNLLMYDYFRNAENKEPETRTVDPGTTLWFKPNSITLWVRNDEEE